MSITYDATNSFFAHDNSGANDHLNWNMLISGSNPFLRVDVQAEFTDVLLSATFNSLAMTLIDKLVVNSGRWCYSFYTPTPAAGTHAVAVTLTGTGYVEGFGSIFNSDVGPISIDSQNKTSLASSTSLTVPTTVVKTGCWLSMFGQTDNGSNGPLVQGGGTTRRLSDTDFDSAATFDSNGAVGTGSQSLAYTLSGSASGVLGIIASLTDVQPTLATWSLPHTQVTGGPLARMVPSGFNPGRS